MRGDIDAQPIQFGPDARHVDVAILWGLGMEDRAHALAKQLRPVEITADDINWPQTDTDPDDNMAISNTPTTEPIGMQWIRHIKRKVRNR